MPEESVERESHKSRKKNVFSVCMVVMLLRDDRRKIAVEILIGG